MSEETEINPDVIGNAVEFQISEADYIQAIKWTYRTKFWFQAVLLFLAFCMACHAAILEKGWMGETGYDVGIYAVGGAIGTVGWFVWRSWWLKRNYRSYKMMQEKQMIWLTPRGIGFKSADNRVMVLWDKIFAWSKRKGFVLIYLGRRAFIFVPTGIEQQGFPLQSLYQMLMEKVGQPK